MYALARMAWPAVCWPVLFSRALVAFKAFKKGLLGFLNQTYATIIALCGQVTKTETSKYAVHEEKKLRRTKDP